MRLSLGFQVGVACASCLPCAALRDQSARAQGVVDDRAGGGNSAASAEPASVVGYDAEMFKDFRFPDANSPFVAYADRWPERWPYGNQSDRRGVVVDEEPRAFAGGIWMGNFAGELIDARRHADAERIYRAGGEAPEGTAWPVRVTPFSPGDMEAGFEPLRRGRSTRLSIDDPGMVFRFVSGREVNRDPRAPLPPADKADGQPAPRDLDVQTAWFSYFPPIVATTSAGAAVPQSTAPKGLVLLLPGLLGTPEGPLTGITTNLRTRGFGVLRMAVHPTSFLKRMNVTLDPDNVATIKPVADELDQRLAECAYASNAAIDHVFESVPSLAGKPVVMVGYSGGAMILPTVAALRPDRVAAAVMVGTGCHFWLMNQTSNYEWWIGAFEIVWKRPPTGAEQQMLDEAYLQHAALDSFHTARALRGKPVLILQGSLDQAVPAPLGEAMWERLGEPERDVHPVTHEWLFMQLPGQFGRIGDWIEAKVR